MSIALSDLPWLSKQNVFPGALPNVALERLGPKTPTQVSVDAGQHGGLEMNFNPCPQARLEISYYLLDVPRVLN